MSTQLEIPESLSEPEAELPSRPAGELSEFDYRPVSTVAITSLILGFVSLLGIFLWMLMPLGLLAVALGIVAIISIRRWKGQYVGTGVAITGVVFGSICLGAGSYIQINAYRHEVPEGYRRVSFIRDISTPSALNAIVAGQLKPAPAIEELLNQKLFFKGFIFPSNQHEGLTTFLLLKDSGECCFGGDPAETDMIRCNLPEGAYMSFIDGRVSVSGTLKLNPDYATKVNAFTGTKKQPIYLLECDMATRSQSDF